MSDKFNIEWLDSGREPQCQPNPKYPNGIDIDLRHDNACDGCSVALPYPAKRCGLYVVVCKACGFSVGITTAGRIDDPRKVILPCHTSPV